MNPDDDEQLDPFEDEDMVFESEDDFPEDDEGVTEDVEEDFIIPAQAFPAPVTIPTIPPAVTIPGIHLQPAPIQGQEATFLAVDELMEEPLEQVWEHPYDQEDDAVEVPTEGHKPDNIALIEDGCFKSYHELMLEVTTASADHIVDMIPQNNEDDWNLNGYNSAIRLAVSRFTLSYLDALIDAVYRGIIKSIVSQRLWKDQETRYGDPLANALPLEIALDLIDDKVQRDHVRDVTTEFFGLSIEELTMVTLDMRHLEASTIIQDYSILSPHSMGQRITDVNRIAYNHTDFGLVEPETPLDHAERISDLNDLDLQEYNLFVHAFGATMVFGYIYLLDFGDEYCTFVARSKPELVSDKELPSFPEAMIEFVEDHAHHVRDINAFNTQYSACHGVLAKSIEAGLVDLVLLALEEIYAGRKGQAHKEDIANLRAQVKQAASQSNNAFGWS